MNDPVLDSNLPPLDLLSTAPAINITALKEHALRCSAKYRAGKFTRVGQDFIDEVLTDVECLIREIRGKYKTLHEPLEPDDRKNGNFVKGALMEKIGEELHRAIGRMIQNKVQKQPTVGVTLGRTR
jgi:hypothetical protein